MITQFTLPPELQQFLSGLSSPALGNILWDITFEEAAPALPFNPGATRRSLMFSRFDGSQYNVYGANIDGANEYFVTEPRDI